MLQVTSGMCIKIQEDFSQGKITPVVLEKTLESALNCKEIKLVNPKINPEYSLEGPMLKLKLQSFGHLM